MWTPRTCRYSVLSRDDARKCLANKKVYVRAVILNVNVQHVGKLTFKLTSRLLPRLLESPFRFFFSRYLFRLCFVAHGGRKRSLLLKSSSFFILLI